MRKYSLLGLGAVLCGVALAAGSDPAMAYTGPGAGITALGSLVSLLAALVLGIVGFVWYPVKRLLKMLRRKKPPASETTTTA